jgi:hypothetical protein
VLHDSVFGNGDEEALDVIGNALSAVIADDETGGLFLDGTTAARSGVATALLFLLFKEFFVELFLKA